MIVALDWAGSDTGTYTLYVYVDAAGRWTTPVLDLSASPNGMIGVVANYTSGGTQSITLEIYKYASAFAAALDAPNSEPDADDLDDSDQPSTTDTEGSEGSKGTDLDDTLVVSDADFASIDGGSGTDTLQLSGGGIDLDFAGDVIQPGHVTGIEVVDLTGSGANTLSVTMEDVLDISTSGTLIVEGDGDDAVNAEGFTATGATETADGATYDVYTNGAATLWIEDEIASVVV